MIIYFPGRKLLNMMLSIVYKTIKWGRNPSCIVLDENNITVQVAVLPANQVYLFTLAQPTRNRSREKSIIQPINQKKNN